MLERKVFTDIDALLDRLADHRWRGHTIVFGNGCFDLLHVGHVRYLQAAAELGDVLVIAVNTDASMARIKPERPPVQPDFERMELIAAIEGVNYVIPLDQNDPVALLERIRPDVHTKGTDYSPEKIPERDVVERFGGRVAIVGDEKNHSTSDLRRRIRSAAQPTV